MPPTTFRQMRDKCKEWYGTRLCTNVAHQRDRYATGEWPLALRYGLHNGVNMWNEFSFANTLTQSSQNRTLPLAIWEFQGQYSMNTPMIMAVLTLTLLPMVIMFIVFQDKLVKGMTAGAVKG